MCVCVRVCVCVCVWVGVGVWVCGCVWAWAWVQRVCLCACASVRAYVFVCAGGRAGVCARRHVCVCRHAQFVDSVSAGGNIPTLDGEREGEEVGVRDVGDGGVRKGREEGDGEWEGGREEDGERDRVRVDYGRSTHRSVRSASYFARLR